MKKIQLEIEQRQKLVSEVKGLVSDCLDAMPNTNVGMTKKILDQLDDFAMTGKATQGTQEFLEFAKHLRENTIKAPEKTPEILKKFEQGVQILTDRQQELVVAICDALVESPNLDDIRQKVMDVMNANPNDIDAMLDWMQYVGVVVNE